MLKSIHHIAIICSDYEQSKQFYTNVLELEVIREVYRASRQSYKLDLALNGQYCIELFSFPSPPKRLSLPESTGLRHLALTTSNLENTMKQLLKKGVQCEPIRVDEYTGKRFTFFKDPDDLPIELYEEPA